jgi:hypothetical protein
VRPCDLSQALTLGAIAEDGRAVHFYWSPADVTALEFRAPHTGADALDNQIALELGDRADDDDHGTAKRPAR